MDCHRPEGAPVATQGPEADWRRYLPEAKLRSLWSRLKQWQERRLGDRRFPEAADICTRGADFGVRIPRPELVLREGAPAGSQAWKLQVYGAALYWHLATALGPGAQNAVAAEGRPPLQGRDVLEVACMRGGGSRYLAEVAGPRLYVATDSSEERVELCRRRHGAASPPSLRFERACLGELAAGRFPASSFDVLLVAEPGEQLRGRESRFAEGARHVLRPGGRLILCDALTAEQLRELAEGLNAAGLVCEDVIDLSRQVSVAGLGELPEGPMLLLPWAAATCASS